MATPSSTRGSGTIGSGGTAIGATEGNPYADRRRRERPGTIAVAGVAPCGHYLLAK